MTGLNIFRNNTTNIVFGPLEELLNNFEKSYEGEAELKRIKGVHNYSSIIENADPLAEGTIVYLVQVDDSPSGDRFISLEKDLQYKILESYDSVFQLTRASFDGGRTADGIGTLKVRGAMYFNT